MAWRTELILGDVDPDCDIEIVCRRCGRSYMRTPAELLAEPGWDQLFIDQVQARLRCRDKHCDGRVRLALLYDHLVTAWVGGMP